MLEIILETVIQQVSKGDNVPKDVPIVVPKEIAKLKDEARIERVGGVKLGFWKVN